MFGNEKNGRLTKRPSYHYLIISASMLHQLQCFLKTGTSPLLKKSCGPDVQHSD